MKGVQTNGHGNSNNIHNMCNDRYNIHLGKKTHKKTLRSVISIIKDVLFIGIITVITYISGSILGELERGYNAFGGGELFALYVPFFYLYKKLWNTGANRK